MKAILEKAYELHSINQKHGLVDIKSMFDRKGSAKFLLDKENKNRLVLDISLELGVSKNDVLEAYKYIVDKATNKNSNDRSKAVAIIFNKKRLMRKVIRSLIYYWYGLVDKTEFIPPVSK